MIHDGRASDGGFGAVHTDDAGMVGRSAPMRELRRRISRAAKHQRSILLVGEAGCGKSLAAAAIHHARGRGSFAVVQAHAATADLSWRSELVSTRGGTLFIAGLEDLSFDAQATLSQALGERRLSSARAQNCPLIVASTRQVGGEPAANGRVRSELVDELGAATILVPPLRDRLADLPDLVSHLLGAFCQRKCACIDRVTPGALAAMAAYPWPRNIRELRHTLDNTVVRGCGAEIDVWDLPVAFHALAPASPPDAAGMSCPPPTADARLGNLPTLAELERRLIEEALRRADGNKSDAARALGISRHKLYDRLRKFG